jgi:hypothetical protein
MLRKLLAATAITALLLFGVVGFAFAADPHSGGSTGPPGQSCQNPATSTTPGNSANSPGSPFNPNGVSGGKYNAAKSQYDVACFQNSQTHP